MATEAASQEASLAALKAELLECIALHETATLEVRSTTAGLQAKVEQVEAQAKEEQKNITKLKEDQAKVVHITEEQGQIIKELRNKLEKSEQYSKLLEEKSLQKGVEDSEDKTKLQHWKMKFDLDAKPHGLKDGGSGFGEWRDKMERYIGSGDDRLVKILRWAEKNKSTIKEEELRFKAEELEWDFAELKQWDYKIQTAIMGSMSGENHMRVHNASTGADAWRVITAKWEPKNVTRAYELRKKCNTIVKARGYGELSTKVELLKKCIKEYEDCSGNKYEDMDRKIALLMICPDRVSEDLKLKGYEGTDVNYDTVLERIEELVHIHGGEAGGGAQIGALGNQQYTQDEIEQWEGQQNIDGYPPPPVPEEGWQTRTELGWVGKGGGGKSGGKGGNKGGGGKGGFAESFQGNCDFCGKYGHRKNKCYWQTVEWYGKEAADVKHGKSGTKG